VIVGIQKKKIKEQEKLLNNFIPIAKPFIGEEEKKAVLEVLESGMLTTGKYTFEFENEFAKYLGKNLYCAGLNSATNALFLSLIALGIKEGDEVIVPTWTFASTSEVVEWIGAKPILCDIDSNTLNINVDEIYKKITSKTKAIIPVHIAGYPCEMDKIANIAKEFNLKVIEDAAHAIGTKFNDIKIGNHSDAVCFSFYATKNLAMGEGGAVVSKDKNLIEKIKKISYLGINKDFYKRYEKKGNWFYDIEELGYKANLDNIHSAIGLMQLKKIDKMNQRRRKIAKYYYDNLKNIEFNKYDSKHYHSYHLFMIRVKNRDEFTAKLKEKNIGSSVHFRPLHKHSFYKDRFKGFKNADSVYKEILSIPMYPGLKDSEVEYIVDTINRII
jgi:perosamine synthetase